MLKKILILFIVSINFVIAQQRITIDANYDRVAKFYWQSGNYIGANSVNTDMTLPQMTYLINGDERWFVLVQWNLPDNLIPDGSIINFVELKFFYQSNNHELDVYYDDIDITGATLAYLNYNGIYANDICAFQSANNVWVINNSNDYPLFKTVVENGLVNNRVTFIIAKSSQINIPGEVSSPSLTITFTPPQQAVTVKQKLSDGTEFGQIGRWENNHWQNYNSGHTFQFGLNTTEYLQSDTNSYSNEKFNNWNDNVTTTFLNYNAYLVGNNVTQLISNFNPIDEINLSVSTENISTQYDSVELKDPWLRDDSSDAKGRRNRGTNAIWHSYASPYSVTTSGEHQGIFLNQGYDGQNWNPPYYSVKAVSLQNIDVNGRTHKFYFRHWEAV